MEIGMKIFPQAYQLTQTFQFVGHRILRRNHTNLRVFLMLFLSSYAPKNQWFKERYTAPKVVIFFF
jgi:hypothetical protein